MNNIKRINLKELNKVLITILIVAVIFHLGRLFLIPIAIGGFLAMLVFPIAQRFERLRLSRPISAMLSVFVILAILIVLGLLVHYQISSFKNDLPDLEEKLQEKAKSLKWSISKETGVTPNEQEDILEKQETDIIYSITNFLKNFIIEGLYVLLMFFVVMAYAFLFLLYRKKLKDFLIKLNLFETQEEARVVLTDISTIAHQYLNGVFKVIAILAIVYSLGFWAIGIKHPLLFAILTALLRIIPYIGSFTGIAFPIAFAFLTKASIWYPLGVLIFFMATQLLEAYFLTPLITGKKVNLNPLATILAILLGHLIWGVLGMVLFVPLVGILKVVFDRIPQLSPFGYLLSKDE